MSFSDFETYKDLIFGISHTSYTTYIYASEYYPVDIFLHSGNTYFMVAHGYTSTAMYAQITINYTNKTVHFNDFYGSTMLKLYAR